MASEVGQELLEVPLPEMVTKLALGIAAAQHALDANSIETATALAEKEIDFVPAITEEIGADGKVTYPKPEKVKMSLLQIGLNPTFYQFSESTIEVTMDIKTTTSEESAVKVTAEAGVNWGCVSASVKTEASFNRKFGHEVHGTSKLMVKLVPVAPPPRLIPTVDIVDNRKKA